MSSYCAFLDLPPELRIIIYENVAADQDFRLKKILKPKSGCDVEIESGLLLANRQINTEYTGEIKAMMWDPAFTITVRVADFNFRRLMSWISTLSASELLKLQRLKLNDPAKLQVYLVMNSLHDFRGENLGRWYAFRFKNTFALRYHAEYPDHCYRFLEPHNRVNGFRGINSDYNDGDDARRISNALEKGWWYSESVREWERMSRAGESVSPLPPPPSGS